MKNLYLTIGIILVLVSLYAFLRDSFILGVIVVAIAAFFVYPDARAMIAGKSISALTYNSIIEQGLRKIEGGNTTIKKETFVESMEKIRGLLSEQQFVPIIGYDSVYLQYNNESAASRALKQVTDKGLKGDIIQDKLTWSVRIFL
ncbi:MAG: hypothetical protein M1306_05475 [Candidatus Thermoplasmatota archaeon]|jgi:hypothetical protein|nr:hypothetical protein [Candidatus Thermoplasmatota archaeon]